MCNCNGSKSPAQCNVSHDLSEHCMFAAPTRKYCERCEFSLAERLHNLVSRNKQCRVQPEGNERYVQSTSGP